MKKKQGKVKGDPFIEVNGVVHRGRISAREKPDEQAGQAQRHGSACAPVIEVLPDEDQARFCQ